MNSLSWPRGQVRMLLASPEPHELVLACRALDWPLVDVSMGPDGRPDGFHFADPSGGFVTWVPALDERFPYVVVEGENRRQTAETLASRVPHHTLDEVLAAWDRAPDPLGRQDAVLAMGVLAPDVARADVLQSLNAAIVDPDPAVRHAALHCAGRVGWPELIPGLESRRIDETDERIRPDIEPVLSSVLTQSGGAS